MSGGDGRLSKQSGDSGFVGESTPKGASGFSPGVLMIGSAGRGGVSGDTGKFFTECVFPSALIIGVAVSGCCGRLVGCGVNESCVGVSVASLACLDFIIGVVVCGTSGVKQGVSCPFSCSSF